MKFYFIRRCQAGLSTTWNCYCPCPPFTLRPWGRSTGSAFFEKDQRGYGFQDHVRYQCIFLFALPTSEFNYRFNSIQSSSFKHDIIWIIDFRTRAWHSAVFHAFLRLFSNFISWISSFLPPSFPFRQSACLRPG